MSRLSKKTVFYKFLLSLVDYTSDNFKGNEDKLMKVTVKYSKKFQEKAPLAKTPYGQA